MPKKLHKSLKIFSSKLKKIRTLSLPNPSSTNSLLSACKYPKTPSFAAGRHAVGPAATLSDVDRFLQENFQSLYLHDDDATAIKPSDRFFVSPGTSSSIADDARLSSTMASSSTSSSTEAELAVPSGSVKVMTFSKDPYDDFHRSMQDMVESRHGGHRQPLDWDFMEELLFCYLELNDRSVHRYILKAFADLTAARGQRRRRKAYRDLEITESGNSSKTATEMAPPQEKVKECYCDHQKHVMNVGLCSSGHMQ